MASSSGRSFANRLRPAYGLVAFFALSLATGRASEATAVRDPVESFLTSRELSKTDVLLRVDLQIKHGRREVHVILVSLGRYTNGKAGNTWSVYRQSGEGFVEYLQTIDFRTDFFYVGYVPLLKSHALVSYWPAGVEHGLLKAYTFTTEAVVEKDLNALVPEGRRRSYLEKLLGPRSEQQRTSMGVERVSVDDLKAKYNLTLRD